MKFLHLGDLHIGKTLGDFDLLDDQRFILDQILDMIRAQQADSILLAGDIYDKAQPSEGAISLFDYFLSKLAEMKINTYIISGNHDSDERLNFGRNLFETNNIHILSVFDGKMAKYVVKDDYGEVDVYLLPFVKASQVKYFYPEAEISSYEDAVRTVIEAAKIDESRRSVIVSHQFVTGGGKDPILGGSERNSVQNVGLIEKIDYRCFQPFDYAALGHIHSPQQIGRETVRYSGSLLKYSLSEVNSNKSVPVVTLKEKGNINIDLVPLAPMRDLRHIRGNMNVLLDAANIDTPNDFIYVTLTDEDIVNDAMSIFQQVYPNTVKIDYDNSHMREIEQVDITKVSENKTFSELIREFYQLIYGCEISDEEMALMKEIAREAGVADETN